ncbi:Rsm22-domain-containing protein [Guyanagaster necrorhizus]|uniref:Rsm22-domain-containing protein n=1 Tax=Guyanagaster necrorhizus TaxID=856835 RepID=A0A9P8AY08_9AGAR|nr:Rsm22-domain-containing protein [Guyanagaster necrorhizus MCA 3950]KAG7452133.1 Rsm22-domain-containing protein [Guyanagaster necrorhizus MCA 3950]
MYRHILRRAFSSTSVSRRGPNPRLNLDPSLQALLNDVDITLLHHKAQDQPVFKELEVVQEADPLLDYEEDELPSEKSTRKSPAATFGSKQIGAVILPLELQNAIMALIEDVDKHRLHEDAKRLFHHTDTHKWDTEYDEKYKSWEHRMRHSERDGTAFASIALPAHYSAITAVLSHVKHRIGPEWLVERVVDWGAGTGSVLWAALHVFQKPDIERPVEQLKAADSTLDSYLGIDKRDGLVEMGKRILHGIPVPPMSDISFRRGLPYPSLDKVPNTLAISAFTLSAQSTPLLRKKIVKEMWDSGAETIVLIDHGTKDGFTAIAEGREALLRMSRVGSDSVFDWEHEVLRGEGAGKVGEGAHVVAPCAHDGECPLLGTKLHCIFEQRLQRPSFVRKTKHSGRGHEDVGYAYVVIRRGPRPLRVPLSEGLGRIGSIGRREAEEEAKEVREIVLTEGFGELEPQEEPLLDKEPHENLVAALRHESYSWPRLVFPPLKKGGHIILDGCTQEGKIVRMTIPRSQGKQEYYDARKSAWGDVFPHEPKKPGQERFQPKRAKKEGPVVEGADIGKGRSKEQKGENLKGPVGYEKLQERLKEDRKKERGFRRARGAAKNYDSEPVVSTY